MTGHHGSTVVYDPAPRASATPTYVANAGPKVSLSLVSLGSYSYAKGTDRLIDIAEAIAARGRRDFLFHIVGESVVPANLSGHLGVIGRNGGSLADYAEQRGGSDFFQYHGQVNDPERILSASDAVIRMSRRGETWGRDIIEGLAFGKPAFAIGTWDGFVVPGESGFLYETFDAQAVADDIIRLGDDPDLRLSMSAKACASIADKCDGERNAAQLVEVWRRAAESRIDRALATCSALE